MEEILVRSKSSVIDAHLLTLTLQAQVSVHEAFGNILIFHYMYVHLFLATKCRTNSIDDVAAICLVCIQYTRIEPELNKRTILLSGFSSNYIGGC